MADDLDLQELADYLHLELNVVRRMADRGKVPGRKIGGEWKFAQAEIHHWLEERIGISDDQELERMGSAFEKLHHQQDLDVQISDLLIETAIAPQLPARTKSSVITAMVDLAMSTGMLWDPDKMENAIRQREEMQPTAIDGGIALLHPRRPLVNILEQPFISLGITGTGIPFGNSAGGLTDIFFLICSTDDTGHLRVLARLARIINSPSFLDELRAVDSTREIKQLFAEKEQEIFSKE